MNSKYRYGIIGQQGRWAIVSRKSKTCGQGCEHWFYLMENQEGTKKLIEPGTGIYLHVNTIEPVGAYL